MRSASSTGFTWTKYSTDKASGKDTNRPQLQATLHHIRAGDTLVVHSMDGLAHNLEDMLRLVSIPPNLLKTVIGRERYDIVLFRQRQ
jgi:DNA invertase Pin-like site-specific DNA recombinase